jgi:hypothetical protein
MAAMAALSHGDRSLAGPRGPSRRAVRHSAAAPEVASVETVPCAGVSARPVPARPAPCHREWTLDAFTLPRITDSVIRWVGCNAIAGACL